MGKKSILRLECSPFVGDIEVGRCQMEYVQPIEKELHRGSVLADAVGDGAKLKIAKRKLTALGTMQGYCSVVNSKDNMARVEVELRVAASCAEISAIEQAKTEKKNAVDNGLLLAEAPAAALKLQTA